MKLVVTGHDASGSAVVSYSGTPPRPAGPGSYELWSTRGELAVPDASDPSAPSSVGYFPTAGETAFKIVSVPPGSREISIGDMPPEIAHHFDPQDPEMHTTDTIDYVIVLDGSADLELDDGRKERVSAGDCIVQRGTRHAWRVVGDAPLVLGAVLIGAQRR